MEELLMNVVRQMAEYLDEEQLDRLQNVLYIQFHGKKIAEDKYELQNTGTDGDTHKVKLFVASKKICGRQDNTLKQYLREISSCRTAINKCFDDMTVMDLRWYFGMLRERQGISMITLQNRMRYLNSFWEFLTAEKMASENPIKRIGTLKIESTIKQAYTSRDLEAMRLSCTRTRDRALIEFLLSTGLRVSELCSLNVGDIDLYKQEVENNGSILRDADQSWKYNARRCTEALESIG